MFSFGRRLRAYMPVPTDDEELSTKRRQPVFRLNSRRGTYLILFVLCANVAFFYWSGKIQGGGSNFHRYRSLRDIWTLERNLPQHNLDLPSPEGREGRYIRFRNQMWDVGLNNQLEETILLSHLAMRSNRAFVFSAGANYPLNAWISGPTAGGPWPAGTDAPRAVNVAFWDQVCPSARRRILIPDEVNAELGIDFTSTKGDVFMDKWAQYLLDLPDNCIELKDGTHQLFDTFFFGRKKLLDLWPQMAVSPVMTHFRFSGPVQDAVAHNLHLISPSSPAIPWSTEAPSGRYAPRPSNAGIQRFVAVHIHRGDFKDHCSKLLDMKAGFASWNLLRDLHDKFTPGAAEELYLRSCWPEVGQIVDRLHKIRAQHDHREGAGHELENVFIMTDGQRAWVNELMLALHEDGWRTVTSSLDLVLDPVEQSVNTAVDMEIARRAEVFVGNGFSTLSSTVTALRLTLNWVPENIRFL
ncbi:hypothetical protein BKA62DRAFT_768849 [Auriculariales sp. MPI-PUGE-AT-0066]|nr:hypothetical protein BKA62DRAFT_768849 [Auriculariales sp. MPI-PUGE-AT-0066]